MNFARTLAPLGASLTVAACVAQQPMPPPATVIPGANKNAAAFQQDRAICQQHAVAHTGYNAPLAGSVPPQAAASPAGAAAPNTQAVVQAVPGDQAAFVQCMAARGDTVQMAASVIGDPGYAYAYPYAPGYPYPYGPYPDAYPYYGGWYGIGWGGGWGWGRGGWGTGGSGHGGFHGGGFHGGGGHGGGHR